MDYNEKSSVKVFPNLTNQGIKKLNESFKGIKFTISYIIAVYRIWAFSHDFPVCLS